jgi:hypothetical protein
MHAENLVPSMGSEITEGTKFFACVFRLSKIPLLTVISPTRKKIKIIKFSLYYSYVRLLTPDWLSQSNFAQFHSRTVLECTSYLKI